MATASTPSASLGQSRTGAAARLILEDPLAYDQATQPTLRASRELVTQGETAMNRDSARELWETLSMDPQTAQQRQAERKKLAAQAATLALEAENAQRQVLQLQQNIDLAERERFQHPLIYGGAVALAGLGALWWLERRKRQRLEEQELEEAALPDSLWPLEAQPSGSLPSAPDQAWEASPEFAKDYSTNLHGFTDPVSSADDTLAERSDQSNDLHTARVNAREPVLTIEPESSPIHDAQKAAANLAAYPVDDIAPAWAKPRAVQLPTEEELVAQSRKKSGGGMLGALRGMLGRFRSSQVEHSPSLQEPSTALNPTSTGPMSTILDTRHHAKASQPNQENNTLPPTIVGDPPAWLRYGPDEEPEANPSVPSVDGMLSQSGDEALLEHLLELRTTVDGLCALGRPQEAALLLETHIGIEPQTTAWAYLQYMQICERLHKPEEFAQMRNAYRAQFNRMPPYWNEPNANILGLDGYARAASELCLAWSSGPAAAKQLIQTWLVGPALGRKFVQLPAFHDLFDLYELLEFAQIQQPAHSPKASDSHSFTTASPSGSQSNSDDADFLPTVSLLDLDYEFSSDVTLDKSDVEKAEKSVTIVKPGEFSLDFNLEGERTGSLFSQPLPLAEK